MHSISRRRWLALARATGGWFAERSQLRGLDPWLRNEPNFWVFRLGRISYGGAGAGGVVDEVGGEEAVVAKGLVVPGGEMSSNLRLGCHGPPDRKRSTRLNSSHLGISYAVFC